MDHRHLRGRLSESIALCYLKCRGLTFVARNFACRSGEIDLIMLDQPELVFVEVRYRRSRRFGGAVASIDRPKQLRIARAAGAYLNRHPRFAASPCRFDVVLISSTPPIRWLKGAFEADDL